MALAAQPCSAAGEFEPNDSLPAAAGPLTIGQTLLAGLEKAGDRDFYFFYVTSPRTTEAVLSVRNLGGGAEISDVDATILDSSATPLKTVAFVGHGEERAAALELAPQKYFVEVTSYEGFGDSYSLSMSGGRGAFGPYARIAGRCASARADIARAHSGLEKARVRVQRATGRLRLARFGRAAARRAARARLQTARRRLGKEKEALRTANQAKRPWCFIPA
jgi:hypothetical protein